MRQHLKYSVFPVSARTRIIATKKKFCLAQGRLRILDGAQAQISTLFMESHSISLRHLEEKQAGSIEMLLYLDITLK